MSKNFDRVLDFVERNVASSLYMLHPDIKSKTSEIRIRVNKPLSITYENENRFINIDGNISKEVPQNAVIISKKSIDESFMLICNNSVYAYEQELANAFVTLENGGRVGIFGEAVYDGNKITAYKNITSLNYRIPREIIGCAEPIKDILLSSRGTIICGPPASSKTTMLRDAIRLLSSDSLGYKRVAVVDSRNEIAAIYNGKISMDLGLTSDVISLSSVKTGIETAIRVMNPEYITLDDILTNDEVEALVSGTRCGVKLIATMHTGSIEEMYQKKTLKTLFENDAVEYIAFIKKAGDAPDVIKILKENINC